jgi:hypothetical protein
VETELVRGMWGCWSAEMDRAMDSPEESLGEGCRVRKRVVGVAPFL